MALKIETAFPGGNVFIEDINNFEVLLTRDMRNTKGDWFYWAFQAHFDQVGQYRFRFTQPNSCSSCGPAVSYDQAMTWEWLGFSCVSGARNEFTYTWDGTKNPCVTFCVGMQYLPQHLEKFFSRHASGNLLTRTSLATSRKNRKTDLLHIEDISIQKKKKYIFLSSRHHCCEMMATYALEGILETALGNDDTGSFFRNNYIIDAVPFVDIDGVLDGDQGKNRSPHDHNRDYNNRPLYPEVKAIQELLAAKNIFFALDLHCPWLFGGEHNESIYFPLPEEKYYSEEIEKFSRILEVKSPSNIPHFSQNNIPFGTKWNTKENFSQGKSLKEWIRAFCAPRLAATIEIPYAKAGENILTANHVRSFGRAIAESIIQYDKQTAKENFLQQ